MMVSKRSKIRLLGASMKVIDGRVITRTIGYSDKVDKFCFYLCDDDNYMVIWHSSFDTLIKQIQNLMPWNNEHLFNNAKIGK